MHPIICTIGPFTFYSYGLMLVAAFLVGSTLARHEAKRQGIDPEVIFNLTFMVFVSGVIGSRILYIVENISYYTANPLEMVKLQHGGLSWFGGLITGVVVSVIYLKKKKLSICRTLDLIVPFLALAQAIGRIGCLLNGCCYGKISTFGIYSKSYDALLIPTQIYSSLTLIAIFIFLRFLQDRQHKRGEIFFAYILLYSIKRFIIEFWRGDNQIVFAGLSLFQFFSLIFFSIALISLIIMKLQKYSR